MSGEQPAPCAADHGRDNSFHIVVVGAGLAGCLSALLLSRLETVPPVAITVLESRRDPRLDDVAAGLDRSGGGGGGGSRSINLALSARGLSALAATGLDGAVREMGVPMHGRCVHDPRGRISTRAYGKKGQFLLSVSRGALNKLLLDACCAQSNVRVVFGAKCTAVDLDQPAVVHSTARGEVDVTLRCDLVVGADGSYSRVRAAMERYVPRFDSSREHIAAVYKELAIPSSAVRAAAAAVASASSKSPGMPDEQRIMPREYLHVWPRHQFMLIALPNQDGSFTATLFLDAVRTEALHAAGGGAVLNFFKTEFPDAVPLLPDVSQQFLTAPTAPLLTVRCQPYNCTDRAVLIGDAAHAIVPFYGQGCNAAFEDCVLLSDAVHRHGRARLGEALQDFFRNRKPDADVIADLAIEHYHDMASNSASWTFAFRRRAGILLHSLLPSVFVPLYSMITFTTVPYSIALERKRKQDRFLAAGVAISIATAIGAGVVRWRLSNSRHTF